MALPASTARQLIARFKLLVRFVVDACANYLDANFFNSNITNGTRLRVLAIHHSLPSLCFMPVWGNETAFLITQAVLKQKGKFTKSMARTHADGQLEVPWSGISMKGCPAWRAILAHSPTFTLRTHVSQQQSSPNNLGDVDSPHIDLFFSCPKCMATRSIERCSLLVRSGWGHILCKACHITTRSMTWTCSCGTPWHTCPVHSLLIRRCSDEHADVANASE